MPNDPNDPGAPVDPLLLVTALLEPGAVTPFKAVQGGASSPEEEADKMPKWVKRLLSKDNREKIEAVALAYGISMKAALNVSVSDQYDSKLASLREAEEEV